MNDIDIDAHIEDLERRLAKLKRLEKLRQEVAALEATNIAASKSTRTMGIISDEVCGKFCLGLDRLRSANRQEEVSVPRQVFFYLCRELREIPFAAIGRYSCRNHGTVIHGRRSILNRIDTDPEFARTVAELAEACKAKLAA